MDLFGTGYILKKENGFLVGKRFVFSEFLDVFVLKKNREKEKESARKCRYKTCTEVTLKSLPKCWEN